MLAACTVPLRDRASGERSVSLLVATNEEIVGLPTRVSSAPTGMSWRYPGNVHCQIRKKWFHFLLISVSKMAKIQCL